MSRTRAVALWLGVFLCALAAHAQAADRMSVSEADRLVAQGPGRDRDKALRNWARDATLPELMYVLRHDAAVLGDVEAPLVEEALDRTSDVRPDLRRRLRVRLALADPRKAKKMLGEAGQTAADAAAFGPRVRASAYRLAVLLPQDGPYASFTEALLAGVRAALAHHNAQTTTPIELEVYATGDDQPARAAAMMDSASRRSTIVIGELLSVPTLAIATGARMSGWPLLSPTATDEMVGAAGPTVFQVGPSAYHRGVTLAARVLNSERLRLAVLMSSDRAGTAFAQGFVHEYERRGGQVVWREEYPAGSMDFRSQVKRMEIEQVNLLLWDGDSREATAFMREIERAHLDIVVCGPESLAPKNFHRSSLALLDGVRYVADDWVLDSRLSAPLDSLVRATGAEEVNSLHLRGFLAGHIASVVVQGRALCPEEIVASLATRVTGDPYLRRRGFLDWSFEGAALPVYEVRSGNPTVLR